jgi:hypothetical protein
MQAQKKAEKNQKSVQDSDVLGHFAKSDIRVAALKTLPQGAKEWLLWLAQAYLKILLNVGPVQIFSLPRGKG